MRRHWWIFVLRHFMNTFWMILVLPCLRLSSNGLCWNLDGEKSLKVCSDTSLSVTPSPSPPQPKSKWNCCHESIPGCYIYTKLRQHLRNVRNCYDEESVLDGWYKLYPHLQGLVVEKISMYSSGSDFALLYIHLNYIQL